MPSAVRLLLLRRGRPRSRDTRVLAAPGPPLGRIDDAVVVGIHPIELRGRSPGGSLLGAMDVLLPSEAAGGRRRWGRRRLAWLSCGLLTCLGEGSCRQQG